jgi:hypothetical protein
MPASIIPKAVQSDRVSSFVALVGLKCAMRGSSREMMAKEFNDDLEGQT